MTFTDPAGLRKPIELATFAVPKDVPDFEQRVGKIPEPDPHYVDLGMLYKLAALERVRRAGVTDTPLHVALRGHMGTGKDHDLEQFAAMLRLPYFRIPPPERGAISRRSGRRSCTAMGGAAPRAAGRTGTSPAPCGARH
jgi:hypothetical protein